MHPFFIHIFAAEEQGQHFNCMHQGPELGLTQLRIGHERRKWI